MSPIDFSSQKLDKGEARKQVATVVRDHPHRIGFSGHARTQMSDRGLTTVDINNVLKSTDAKITSEGELTNGTYRYQLRTTNITVVIAFGQSGQSLTVVTAWYNAKPGRR